jgi:two-component system cell cycle sensor histidine kinase PleC
MALMTKSRPDVETLLELAIHEFRSPTSVLLGYNNMLSSEAFGPLTAKQRFVVDESGKSCRRVAELIGEMKDLLELEAGTAAFAREDVAFEAHVHGAASAATEGRDRGVVLEHQSDESPLVVEGDRARLLAAVDIVLRVALREQGSAATVLARTSRITVGGRDMAALAVGVADAARIVLEDFTPEAYLNEGRGGLGFVLPIARRIVERHGGRIWSSGPERMVGSIAFVLPLKETRS